MRSGAAWFLPLLFALACLSAAPNTVRTGYAAGDLAQSSVGVYVAAPLAAAFLALQYRGFTGLVRPLRSTRSGLRVVLAAWWPLILGAPMTLCLAVVVTAGALPDDMSASALVVVDFMTVLAAALTGVACAWALPAVIAIPAAGLGWFLWISYGPASTSVLVHNLDSTFGCCSSDTRPSVAAVGATLLLLSVVTLGIAGLLASPGSARLPRPLVAASTALILCVGAAGGLAVLHASGQRLNLTGTEPRSTPLACTSTSDLHICLWPENRDRTAALAAIVRGLNPELQRHGLATIHGLTQAHRNIGSVSVEAGGGLSDLDLRTGLASGYVDLQAGCSGTGPTRSQLVALVALLAGERAEDLRDRLGPTATSAAQEALDHGSSPQELGAWFRAHLADLQCASQR